MASTPGVLTHWPWEPLGNFKYVLVAPWVVHGIYLFLVKGERDFSYVSIFPMMLWRMLHNQIWISVARHRTAKGNNLIVDRSLEFEQVDRERSWDDQILLHGISFYMFNWGLDGARNLPLWRADGMVLAFLLHIGPVEFLYYWLHRALHHHFLYSRYHSHHHSSIVTEPITSVVHPFAEHIAYFLLFAIPLLTTSLAGMNSIFTTVAYLTYVDFMNNMGHCNFEVVPKFHSLHHTQFRTNYSLFMPFYDYIHGTMDKSTDSLYESSLKRSEDVPDVVHLTHLTTPQSIYHLRLGFASLASKPLTPKWYLWLMWPVTLWSMIMAWIYGRTSFIVERNTFQKLKLQSWLIPRYIMHYAINSQREAINQMIEEAILEADAKGIKVVSLGLLNQGEELNRNGKLYLEKNPKLKVKVIDGSSLAVAVVLHSIPKGTSKVFFRGRLCKVAYSIVSILCHKGIQVVVIRKDEYEKLRRNISSESADYLGIYGEVGDDFTKHEQFMAQKGSLFIPFSQFPPKKARKDCIYLNTPALVAPKSFGNLHSCENWLPRRVMSAWRVAGIVHALEGWEANECGDELLDIDKVWEASLRHGFRPVLTLAASLTLTSFKRR
ncbi:hypothetical protein Cgig2_008979 [Carnegiea gigantea]|uniref:Fatty acid hydroxylase domain-containing protein n=1 Tax=Carnegiea gigantea TaxID=171969 RepID=A0A9Q1QDT8_9CARY|nr:hypothetical protein Cgig2_008979 [Carnegiea gigantea]